MKPPFILEVNEDGVGCVTCNLSVNWSGSGIYASGRSVQKPEKYAKIDAIEKALNRNAAEKEALYELLDACLEED
jgi:hypothetical protein